MWLKRKLSELISSRKTTATIRWFWLEAKTHQQTRFRHGLGLLSQLQIVHRKSKVKAKNLPFSHPSLFRVTFNVLSFRTQQSYLKGNPQQSMAGEYGGAVYEMFRTTEVCSEHLKPSLFQQRCYWCQLTPQGRAGLYFWFWCFGLDPPSGCGCLFKLG